MNEKNVSIGAAIGVALLSWLLIGTICIVGTMERPVRLDRPIERRIRGPYLRHRMRLEL